MEEVERLVKESDLFLEIVHCGNPKVTVEAARLIAQNNAHERVIIGNDAPSGTGVVPLGILRVLNMLASLTPIAPEQAICMATGNTARAHKLNRGVIETGREADMVVMDAPMGSVGEDALGAVEAGDNPGVAIVVVDGEIVLTKSRNTPPPVRTPEIIRK
jgi:enamidase